MQPKTIGKIIYGKSTHQPHGIVYQDTKSLNSTIIVLKLEEEKQNQLHQIYG